MKVVPLIVAALIAAPALADHEQGHNQNQDIKFELRTDSDQYQPGDIVDVELWAVLVSDLEPATLSAVDVNIRWEAGNMDLLGANQTGGPPVQYAGFTQAGCLEGANEYDPPADGDGYYTMWLQLGTPATVPPGDQGLFLTAFNFQSRDNFEGFTSVQLFGYPDPWTITCPDTGQPWNIKMAAYWGVTPNFNLLTSYSDVGFTIGNAGPPEPPTEEEILMAIVVAVVENCDCPEAFEGGLQVREWIMRNREMFIADRKRKGGR